MTTAREAFESMEWGPAPESVAEVMQWLGTPARRFGHFVGGAFVEPMDGQWFDTVNPATNEVLAAIGHGSGGDVDRAVDSARTAQPLWLALGGHRRARHVSALARGLERQSQRFAVLESLDGGKPIHASRDVDIPLAVRHLHHHAGWAQLMDAELPGYAPVGVVGQITPWDSPLLMLAWKIAPALAMGNTVVLKPAEYTSLTALLFAELCAEAGLPPGVVNVVTGDGHTGELLVSHGDVDKIAFTGSTEVGRRIRIATAGSGKRLSLELGGKSPFVVFEDADLDSAVEAVVDAIWSNPGQVCCPGSRILVQESVASELVAKLRRRMEGLRVGDPLDKAVDVGPIIAPGQLQRIRRLVQQGVDEGATLWQPSWACPTEGPFYPPTLFTDVAPAAAIAQVEMVGPVAVTMTFRTATEAVALANDTRYGLAASIWSENVNTALDVAPAIKAGTVWVNCTNVFDAASGFGGYRESGFGREGGREGLWQYVRKRRATGKPLASKMPKRAAAPDSGHGGAVNRAYKLYIGGRQVPPDSGHTLVINDAAGRTVARVGSGNRKDIRNAVEAACRAAAAWRVTTAHRRAQMLYGLGENLSLRAGELAAGLRAGGLTARRALAEVDRSIERCAWAAAWADKFDGRVHATPYRNITFQMNEPIGVMGVVAPNGSPLEGFLTAVLIPVAVGNVVVAVPSVRWPLPALDCCQLFDASGVPPGVINIVTGQLDELAPALAAHEDVEALWYFGPDDLAEDVERLSAGNLKRTWVPADPAIDWSNVDDGWLREAVQVKNVWVPYGA